MNGWVSTDPLWEPMRSWVRGGLEHEREALRRCSHAEVVDTTLEVVEHLVGVRSQQIGSSAARYAEAFVRRVEYDSPRTEQFWTAVWLQVRGQHADAREVLGRCSRDAVVESALEVIEFLVCGIAFELASSPEPSAETAMPSMEFTPVVPRGCEN